MTAKPKPEHSPKSAPAGPEPDPTPEEETARIRRLIAEGRLIPPKDTGPVPADLLEPGPWCPSAVEALIEDRRSGP